MNPTNVRLTSWALVTGSVVATAGGSTYFDAVADVLSIGSVRGRRVRTIVRSGCYLTHDHGSYAASHANVPSSVGKPRLLPAIEVWAVVISLPEPGLAIVALGKRDVSYDEGMPVPLRVRRDGVVTDLEGAAVTKLNDQHAFVTVDSESSLRLGDLVAFGISHPCTTFDKWRVIPIVDDEYRVETIAQTLFH
jgi:D-serine deaminase-like pyridoxal phosphate-dependent protein